MKLLLLAALSSLVSSTPIPERYAAQEIFATATIYPSLIVNICSDNTGWPNNIAGINRTPPAPECNTLLAYTFSKGYPGKTCTFRKGYPGKTCTFSFTEAEEAGGTRQVQVFTIGGEITKSTTWTNRPYRDVYLSAFTLAADSLTASWDGGKPPTWKCPSKAGTWGFEGVPMGDSDYVSWWGHKGLGIVVL